MNSKRGSTALIIIIIVIIVIILGLVSYFVFRNKGEEPLGPSGEPSTQPSPSGEPSTSLSSCDDARVGDVVCSNGMYAVTKVGGFARYKGWACSLTGESIHKLLEAIKKHGDIALEGISDLTCITAFDLSRIDISDSNLLSNVRPLISDVSPLRNLTGLIQLSLSKTNVSDISPLSNLTNLKELVLSHTNVSDISPLSNLAELRELDLGWTNVSDISPLSNLTNLKILSLSDTNVSDISSLSNLTNLQILYLNHTNVSDISPLSNLTTNLNQLSLSHTPVSDLSPLSNLTELMNLELYETMVPEENCLELEQKLGEGVVHCHLYYHGAY